MLAVSSVPHFFTFMVSEEIPMLRFTTRPATGPIRKLVLVVVVAVAFSSLARIWEECSTIHLPACAFCLFAFEVDFSSRTLIPLFMSV